MRKHDTAQRLKRLYQRIAQKTSGADALAQCVSDLAEWIDKRYTDDYVVFLCRKYGITEEA